MKKPNLKIIEDAIERIEMGVNSLSCLALNGAGHELMARESSSQRLAYMHHMKAQYRRYCMHANGGRLPRWWNQPRLPSRQQQRVEALRGFRQACIDAGAGKFLA